MNQKNFIQIIVLALLITSIFVTAINAKVPNNTPPGLSIAPGIQKKLATSTATTTKPGAIPAIPATPAKPHPGTGTPATPATSATPATPAVPPWAKRDTTPPVISNIQVSNTICTTSVIISWVTDEDSNSVARYGLATSSYEFVMNGTTTATGSTTAPFLHQVNLPNLISETTYYYKVSSTDNSRNMAESEEQSFTTIIPDITPPIISNVQVRVMGETYTDITWNTDKAGDRFVEYGLTVNYGSKTFPVRAHAIALTKLNASTTYHYRVSSADYCGNRAYSSDYIFTTLPSNGVTIESGSGVVPDASPWHFTIGTGNIEYSLGSASGGTGYIYSGGFTNPLLYFGDVTSASPCWGGRPGYQGISDICQFTSASNHTFSNEPYTIMVGDKNSSCYQGILIFHQGDLYGALEFEDIDSSGNLHYNYWYDESGGSDFSSLCNG